MTNINLYLIFLLAITAVSLWIAGLRNCNNRTRYIFSIPFFLDRKEFSGRGYFYVQLLRLLGLGIVIFSIIVGVGSFDKDQ